MAAGRQLIDGESVDAADGGTWDLVNPATGQVIDVVPYGNGIDAGRAILAASEAFESWKDLGPYARGEILNRAADLIAERAERYGVITTEESGKPIAQAIAEWQSAPSYLRFAASEAPRIEGRIIPSRVLGRRIDVTYSPIGVVGVIAAWNFPVYNINRAVSSALGAGCLRPLGLRHRRGERVVPRHRRGPFRRREAVRNGSRVRNRGNPRVPRAENAILPGSVT